MVPRMQLAGFVALDCIGVVAKGVIMGWDRQVWGLDWNVKKL
jgi:hypothetical protein